MFLLSPNKGDIAIETETGRMVAALHILISVANLGELFATIDELNTNRTALLERVERLNHRYRRSCAWLLLLA